MPVQPEPLPRAKKFIALLFSMPNAFSGSGAARLNVGSRAMSSKTNFSKPMRPSFVRNVLPAFFSVSVLQFLDLTLAAVFSNHVLKESMSFRPALKLSAEAVKRPPYWKRRRSELAGSSVFLSASASLQPVADLMNAKASASIGSSLLW